MWQQLTRVQVLTVCGCCCYVCCRFTPISDEASGQLGSEDGGGAGVKAAEPTDWNSDGEPSEDGEPAAAAAQGNGTPGLAGSSSRGRLSAL